MRVLFLESHPLFIHGLPNGFRDAGHDVVVSGPLSPTNIPDLVSEFRPNLIVTLGCGPEHVAEKQAWIQSSVHESGIPHVYWATEDPTHTFTFTIPYIQGVQPNFVFTICPLRVKTYEDLGFPAAHLDFGFHPSVHRRTKRWRKYGHSIAVVANAYPQLQQTYPEHYRITSFNTLIRPLIENRVRTNFYGQYWDQLVDYAGEQMPKRWVHGYLPYPKAYRVYNSCRIIMGLQNHTTQLTQRTYETLGSGGFLLTNDTAAIRERFEVGRDLVVSASSEETVPLVNYYLTHRDERLKIRQSGYEVVQPHHYKYRAQQMIRVLVKQGILSSKLLCH